MVINDSPIEDKLADKDFTNHQRPSEAWTGYASRLAREAASRATFIAEQLGDANIASTPLSEVDAMLVSVGDAMSELRALADILSSTLARPVGDARYYARKRAQAQSSEPHR